MNHQEISDFEIDCMVARIIHNDFKIEKDKQLITIKEEVCKGIVMEKPYYPTSSWADAGKIAQEYKISILAPRFGESWTAEHTGSDEDVNDGFEVDYFEHHHENPCRAICIVFLMMKGGE